LAEAIETIPTLLHVEDDVDLGKGIRAAIAGRAHVVTATTLREAERVLRETPIALIVLDLALPDGNGLSLLDRIPALTGRSVAVVILSGSEVPGNIRAQVDAVLVKSRVSEAELVSTILGCLPPAAT